MSYNLGTEDITVLDRTKKLNDGNHHVVRWHPAMLWPCVHSITVLYCTLLSCTVHCTLSWCCRFERNGPNSTLQVDDHKKIVNTPDGRQTALDIHYTISLLLLQAATSPSSTPSRWCRWVGGGTRRTRPWTGPSRYHHHTSESIYIHLSVHAPATHYWHS